MSIINDLSRTPHKLFLIDGFGALLSALMLGGVLVRFNNLVGLTSNVLFFLALFPVVYAVYDLYCYRTVQNRLIQKTKGIIMLNILYSCISIAVVYLYRESITIVGHCYFISEIIIILILVGMELKVVKQLQTQE